MGGLGAVWRFFRRHRRKFFFVGTALAGAYFALKYAREKLEEFQQLKMTEAFATARKQTHYESNQRTCNATVLSLISTLRENVMSELNCERLTEQLQHKPSNKVYIWGELKLLSFTRAVVSIYATSVLILTLRVQLNIIGGCNYVRSEQEQTITEQDSVVQQRYLETIQGFMTSGVQQLSELVRHRVEKEMMNVTLKQSFTVDSFKELVNKVRVVVERMDSDAPRSPFSKLVMSPTNQLNQHQSDYIDGSLRHLVSETQEIINSPDYHYVLQATIDHGFENLYQHLHKVFSTGVTDPQTLHQGTNCSPSLAMAKLIPPLVGSVHIFCSDTTNDYLQQLLTLPCVNDLGHHVYQSFCEPVVPA